MSRIEKDEIREERIIMEIVVDAYDEGERAMGWYYYLQSNLSFPFKAQCIAEDEASPLEAGEKVEVISQPSEAACEHSMLVNIKWKKRTLAVPLSQLQLLEGDEETQQAIEDWHYWIARGYEF